MPEDFNVPIANLVVKMAMMMEVSLEQDDFRITEELMLNRLADLIGKEQALEQVIAYTRAKPPTGDSSDA